MTKFTFQKAQPSDLARLVSIDNQACEIYAEAGLHFDLAEDHPFVLSESKRWQKAINNGLVDVALDAKGEIVAFAACGYVDGLPYLDQLSVLPSHMRKGVGRALLQQAKKWSQSELWLTTYDHLPWNRPYYQSHGFEVVSPEHWGNEMTEIINEQRLALPKPNERVVMVWRNSRS